RNCELERNVPICPTIPSLPYGLRRLRNVGQNHIKLIGIVRSHSDAYAVWNNSHSEGRNPDRGPTLRVSEGRAAHADKGKNAGKNERIPHTAHIWMSIGQQRR